MKLDKVEEAFPEIMNPIICVISRGHFARNARQNQEVHVRGMCNFGMLLSFNSREMFGERSQCCIRMSLYFLAIGFSFSDS